MECPPNSNNCRVNKLDELATTTIAIKKTQKEKLDVIKLKVKAKTYAEVIDLLLKTYESYTKSKANTIEKVVEVEEVRRAVMPFELEMVIRETCKNNPELKAYTMFFIKKYGLEKYRGWAERWNYEVDCSQWNT